MLVGPLAYVEHRVPMPIIVFLLLRQLDVSEGLAGDDAEGI